MGLTIAPAAAATILLTVLSLGWAQIHDTPIFMYEGFLIVNDGTVPYRDLFEVNMPGTFVIYSTIVATLGTSDFAVRAADLGCLGVVSTSTWLFLRHVDKVAAFGAVALFIWMYLSFGPSLALQRDFLLLAPISVATLLASREWRSSAAKVSVVGLVFGLATLIKPQALVGAVPIAWYALAVQEGRIALRRDLVLFTGALIAPGAIAIAVLLGYGALDDFWSMARNYWPLYGQLDWTHTAVTGTARLKYLVSGTQTLGGDATWLIPGVLGAYNVAWVHRDDRRRARAALYLCSITIAFAVYPALSGQFFIYHWTPFRYCCVLLAVLCFVRYEAVPSLPGRHVAFAMLLPLLLSPLATRSFDTVRYSGAEKGLNPELRQKLPRVAGIETFLRANLRPGDTVQPLDWTGGAAHAMLRAKAHLATPYIYDVHFYHHVSHAYIQDLRRRFIVDMTSVRPRFVVEIVKGKDTVRGPDTTQAFPELRALLQSRYTTAQRTDEYVIYALRGTPVSSP